MEQNKSTISLHDEQPQKTWAAAPPDSDWGKVEQFVIDRGKSPVFVSWESYIACMILSYEGDLESENMTEEELPLDEWLNTWIGMNYRMEDFDYE